MSNLIPEQRADRNGKIVTRHVKAETETTTSRALPAPSICKTATAVTFERDDIMYEALQRNKPDDVDSYFKFITRKPDVVQNALAKALASTTDKDETDATFATFEAWSTNPALMKLAMDDIKFIVELARSTDGKLHDTSSDPFSGVMSVMESAFRENFKKDAINPETVDTEKYGPLLRAATITRALGMDNLAPTSMDEHLQRQHVIENIDTFTRNYPVLIRVVGSGRTNHDSHAMLEVCEILDEDPAAGEVLLSYVQERQRLDVDEFRSLLAGPSRSLSEGTL